jgi:hypothetical protein
VVAGSLPTNKQGALPQIDPAGCLVVLSDEGVPVETFTGKDIDGPWDLTVSSTPTSAEIYVSDALGDEVDAHLGGSAGESNGIATGTADVVRLDIALSDTAPPELVKTTVIGKGFPWSANNAALDANAVYAVRDAATRSTAITASAAVISSGGALNEPLGMTFTPMDDLLIMNGNDGNAVEISPSGKQLGSETVIGNGAGDLIGLTLTPTANGILFGNDSTNALDLLH